MTKPGQVKVIKEEPCISCGELHGEENPLWMDVISMGCIDGRDEMGTRRGGMFTNLEGPCPKSGEMLKVRVTKWNDGEQTSRWEKVEVGDE